MATTGSATFVSDRPDALAALGSYLREHGVATTCVGTGELDRLDSARPDVAIVGMDTAALWRDRPAREVARIFEQRRVIGLGSGGAALSVPLGLELHSVVHGHETQVVVECGGPLAPLPSVTGRSVELYQPGQGEVLGVHDHFGTMENGVPCEPGFEGIARWPGDEHYWPIACQGSYVLWGFDAPTDQMTEVGRQVFLRLLQTRLGAPPVRLSQARKRRAFVAPGRVSGVLTAEYSGSRWNCQVRQRGRIRAALSWQPAAQELALILNGPGQVSYFARLDGVAPQTIEYEVTDEHLARGADWQISAMCFAFGCSACQAVADRIDFQLELDFPASDSTPASAGDRSGSALCESPS
jgi:hypothetical protein